MGVHEEKLGTKQKRVAGRSLQPSFYGNIPVFEPAYISANDQRMINR
jgi:hypothetical protein